MLFRLQFPCFAPSYALSRPRQSSTKIKAVLTSRPHAGEGALLPPSRKGAFHISKSIFTTCGHSKRGLQTLPKGEEGDDS